MVLEGWRLKSLMFYGFGRIREGLGLKSLILLWFWQDLGRLDAEIFDVVLVMGRVLEGLRLKSLMLFWFWKDFGRLLEGLGLNSFFL